MKKLGLAPVLLCLVAVPAMAQIPDEFTNLKIFPKDIGKRELVSVMRQFAGALGVRCNHCHKGPENLEGMDFATDELETKRVTRAMMKMTGEINDELLAGDRPGVVAASALRHLSPRGIARPEQLGDILEAALEADGVDGAIARFQELRGEHYGAGSYDFGAGTLNGLAETAGPRQGRHGRRDQGDAS